MEAGTSVAKLLATDRDSGELGRVSRVMIRVMIVMMIVMMMMMMMMMMPGVHPLLSSGRHEGCPHD